MHSKYCSSIMRLHGKPAQCGPWPSNLTEWRTPASLCSAAKGSRKEGLEGRVGLGDLRNLLSYRARQATWGQDCTGDLLPFIVHSRAVWEAA